MSGRRTFKMNPFEDDDMNEEVKAMLARDLLEKDRYELNTTAEVPSRTSSDRYTYNSARPFEDDDMNDEVKAMIARDLLEKNRFEFNATAEVPSRTSSQRYTDNPTSLFEDDDMNDEVKAMLARELLEKTRYELNSTAEVPSRTSSHRYTDNPARPYVDYYDMNEEVKNINLQEKTTNAGKSKDFKLERLTSNDATFQKISADFRNSKLKIRSIQKVENKITKKFFEDEKNAMKHQFGDDFELNLKDLYHGTCVPKNNICCYGLDVRLSRKGMFGHGIYFSDNVMKCEKYLSENNGGSIYVCSVILGDMKEYPNQERAIHLKTEPTKENGDRYHSVKGNVDGFNEYVIYESRRSLIKYRIVLDDEEEDEDEDEDEDKQKPHKYDTDELDDKYEPIVSEFMKKTDCDDVEFAKMILKQQNFDLENSVNYYEATICSD